MEDIYWVLRDVHRTMWQLREKERGVCQLSSSLSYFASAPFMYSSSLFHSFYCDYSFSLPLTQFFVPHLTSFVLSAPDTLPQSDAQLQCVYGDPWFGPSAVRVQFSDPPKK